MTEPSREQLLERIAELERERRCVQAHGLAYLIQHGDKQIAIDPRDVTIVLPHDTPADMPGVLALAMALDERIRKVRETCDGVSKYDEESRLDLSRDVLAALDGEDEER